MSRLNYRHLHYFWSVAKEGSLTRAAQQLHVSQSALSVQLRQLEDRLGQPLFERRGRRLHLTEAGRIALEYADTIYRSGEELLSVLTSGAQPHRQVLRIGAVTTLSRNFQIELVRPLLAMADLELVMRSGSLSELLGQLRAHSLDVVLSNLAVARDAASPLHSHLIARQPVSLVGRRTRSRKVLRFPDDLHDMPLALPSLQSNLRADFDLLLERAGVRPRIVAEVDDMAMLRLIARESSALSLVPPVVVQEELRSGVLVERCRIAQIQESFYAITASRRFANPLLKSLLEPLARQASAARPV
ncbi:MAG: LysR family transcriptional regulator [Betaproteobacteria bacterium]|nr:LysR family transcriptional regulator [Betaproteobacteria bacterium]